MLMAQSRTWTSGFNKPNEINTAAVAGKLQLMQSPTFRHAPMTQGAFFRRNSAFGVRSHGSLTVGASGTKRSQSASQLDIAEVRALGGDAPVKGDATDTNLAAKGTHEALLQRIKSRAARLEAEKNRDFLAKYKDNMFAADESAAQDAHLDAVLKAIEKRETELKQRSEDLQVEAREAERKLEFTNSMDLGRASETELQALNAFERSQRRIQEDKKEEEYQKQRDEAQATYAKVNRRLQSELIELRDYKVLLREYRRIRLEKLSETLGKVQDGRRLRNCVRVMIRNGAQRILARLETANLPLEPWMREVLVNCCHVEIRLEDAESRLLVLRREALHPVKGDVQAMMSQTKAERFDKLCTRTWEMRQQRLGIVNSGEQLGEGGVTHAAEWDPSGTNAQGDDSPTTMQAPPEFVCTASSASIDFMASSSKLADVPEKVNRDMRAAEEEISSLRRLLADMRHNAAAVICNQIRQAHRSSGVNKQAMAWGQLMLSLLVSEDFAKSTMKDLQKLAPTATLTQ